MATQTAEAPRPARPVLLPRVSWSLAAASTVWAGANLMTQWPSRWWLCLALAAWFGAATWATTRWPWPGVLLTGAGVLALDLLALPQENAAPLGPLGIALVTIGYLLPPWSSIWAVPVLLACTATAGGWDLPSIAFGLVLLLMFWCFGVLVRGRHVRLLQAQEDAARLALVDPSAQALRAAMVEREGVASAALAEIGQAVQQMTQTAVAAQATLEPAAIDAIHRTGEQTVERLRALLVPLRPGPQKMPTAPVTEPPAPTAERARPRWLDVLQALWPAALILLDVLLVPVLMVATDAADAAAPPGAPFLLLVVVPLLCAVALRSRFPTGALWATTAVLVLGVLTGLADLSRDGLWLAIAATTLSWSAGRAGTRRATLAWVAFTVTLLALIATRTLDNLPIQIAMTVLPFGAAAAWAGHHAAAATHRHEAAVRLAEIDAAERAAVAHERLSLARDLHDAASHAVGTMMMQANAARVLRDRDPEAARAALATIAATGSDAVEELRVLTAAPAPPPGAGSVAATLAADDLGTPIAPFVDAARRTGAEVTLTLEVRDAVGRSDLQLLVRIVREGLANAARHAPGCEVAVTVRVARGSAQVSVANGPARRGPSEAPSAVGTGLGHRGLQELLGEHDGELTAGPDGEGYRLRAEFPLRIAAPVIAP